MQTAAFNLVLRGGCTIPYQINYSLTALHLCLNLFQLFILPLCLLPKSVWWGLCIIPIALMNNPLWALIHEAIHDLLSRNSRVNSMLGRVLGICFGSPFHVLRLTHLSHHKFNRSPLEKGTEIYNPWQVSRRAASIKYFFYILCGLYLLEVFSTLLFFLPGKMFERMRKRVMLTGNTQEKWLANKFNDAKRLREIRMDGIAICLVFTLSAMCYREHWPFFVGLLMARAFLISLLDNVYHYGTPLNVTISALNLSTPRIFSALILHFNLHRVHHANPHIPWKSLPFAGQADKFDRGLWTAVLRQFYGPTPLLVIFLQPANKQLRPQNSDSRYCVDDTGR